MVCFLHAGTGARGVQFGGEAALVLAASPLGERPTAEVGELDAGDPAECFMVEQQLRDNVAIRGDARGNRGVVEDPAEPQSMECEEIRGGCAMVLRHAATMVLQ